MRIINSLNHSQAKQDSDAAIQMALLYTYERICAHVLLLYVGKCYAYTQQLLHGANILDQNFDYL